MRKLVAIMLSAMLIALAAGAFAAPVEVTMIAGNAGNDSNIEFNRSLWDEFNQKYEGQYLLKVEEVPGVAIDVRTKLKMLNAAGQLPTIVTDLSAEAAFADQLMQNNRLIDLKPFFDASPEWQATALDVSVEYNTKDGKMLTAPANTSSYVGIYYNKEMLTAAGYDAFPETWDDFFALLDKLKESGQTGISLHTTETGWCPMLAGIAYMSQTEAGVSFISNRYPTDFNNPEFVGMMDMIARLFTYSTKDSVGGNYPLAANNFASGNTAMIPNGPWMISSLSDPQFSPPGFEEKVGYTAFPGHVMLSDEGAAYGSGISVDVSAESQAGGVEWLKFQALPEVINRYTVVQGAMSPKVKLPDDMKATLSPVMQEYVNAVEAIQTVVPNHQGKWDPITQNEVIPQELPNLINGKITAEEFAQKMTEGALKYAAEGDAAAAE